MKYEATLESVRKHPVPDWYHDAKLGIFIHWGLFSVPAFASTKTGDLLNSIRKYGFREHFKHNPYAEWYLNTLRIEGSPTQEHHFRTYGKDFPYDDFIPIFNRGAEHWDPAEWAAIFKKINAKYVVLVSKHADGFTLWPSNRDNPRKGRYCAGRNIVGELTEAVRKQGLKMGLYYSTGWDWSFQPNPVYDLISFMCNGPIEAQYREYCRSHLLELIDTFAPSIIWGDICYPPKANVNEIFAYYYNNVPDGLVNDRWFQSSVFLMKLMQFAPLGKISRQINGAVADAVGRFVASHLGVMQLKPPHCDYVTPEYASFKEIKKKKWEACRGIGYSFGHNKFAPESDFITTDELIRSFIDIVSKNGNLLLNVGPTADGKIAEIEKDRLVGLGTWLDINGEAIFGARPWKKAEGKASDGIDIRFTNRNRCVYAILLDKPQSESITFEFEDEGNVSDIRLLGSDVKINWKRQGKNLTLSMPDDVRRSPAYAFGINIAPG